VPERECDVIVFNDFEDMAAIMRGSPPLTPPSKGGDIA
jgi:hypothetical protein